MDSSSNSGEGSSSGRGAHREQHVVDYDDDSVSVCSGTSTGSNPRRNKLKSNAARMDNIDEEQGYNNERYEMKSLLRSDTNSGGGGGGNGNGKNKKQQQQQQHNNKKHWHNKSSAAIDHGNVNDDNASISSTALLLGDADDTKNKSQSDLRSRTLFLKTAFWITCWYGTSLATLFLNKIILSRPGSSVHVLGMCQMTTAAVLGGWSAFGGADYVINGAMCVWRCVPEGVRSRVGYMGNSSSSSSSSSSRGNNTSGNNKGGDHDENNNKLSGTNPNSNESGTPSKQSAPPAPGMGFHFVRDMSIVGVLRGITVVLGLIALEHVPVSFVETIKATAPAFTVLFARLILAERTSAPVMLTLVPVVAGLVLCSASELRFDLVGFVAAVMNNCADCVQNVMSKRMLAHLKPTQLQFYTSVAALALQTPFVLRDATGLIRGWLQGSAGEEAEALSAAASMLSLDGEANGINNDPSFHQGMSYTKLLLIDAVFYHLQSVSAYCTMGCMSPVSQSVANTLKRALLVWASILYFGNPVTNSGIVGVLMVVSGVFLYNHVRRIYQS